MKPDTIYVLTTDLHLLTFTLLLLLLKKGSQVLIDKIKKYKPRIAVFNGKGIYEVFSGQREFHFGKQPEKISDTDTVSFHSLYFNC